MSAILIWGAGAIGGSIGAALAHAGHDVRFVDRAADHVAAINRSGLEITGPVRRYRVHAPACTPEQVEGSFATVLLCVKAQDTEAATRVLAPRLAADGVVVSAQNGLNERVIAGIVGAARTIGCFVNFGADYHGPGLVMYGGRGAVVVGELDGRRTARVEAVHGLLQTFDGDAILTGNIWGFLWSKLIYGALLFATALTEAPIADVLEAKRYRPALTVLGQEIARVAAAERVRLERFDGFDPAAFAAGAPKGALARSFTDMVAFNRRSAKTHSGIWRDLAVRKRRTEIDAQIGPVVEIGARRGMPTPLSERLITLIHDIENGRRAQGWGTLDALAAAHQPAAAGSVA